MASVDVSLEELIETRERLIHDINQDMTEKERRFLLSVKNKKPDFTLLEVENPELIAELPSVKWRLINLEKMTKEKHKKAYENLELVLYPKDV